MSVSKRLSAMVSAEMSGHGRRLTRIQKSSKSVPCFMLGQREPIAARDFLEVLAGRLANRVQLTSDGLKAYLTAVKSALETISTLPNW